MCLVVASLSLMSCSPAEAQQSDQLVIIERTDVPVMLTSLNECYAITAYQDYDVFEISLERGVLNFEESTKVQVNEIALGSLAYYTDWDHVRPWCTEQAYSNLITTYLNQNKTEVLTFYVGIKSYDKIISPNRFS